MKHIKKDPLLIISTIIAIITTLIVGFPKDLKFLHIDTLLLLYMQMIVVYSLTEENFFDFISQKILKKVSSAKKFSILLVNLYFVYSMFVSNDITLLTFVPLTISIIGNSNPNYLIKLLVLQTIAANLGGMMMPQGNPQNVFIFAQYNMSLYDFLSCVIPLGLIAVILINLIMFSWKNGNSINIDTNKTIKLNYPKICLLLISFILLVITVIQRQLIVYTSIFTLTVILFIEPKSIYHADYELLATFVVLFLTSYNISNMPAVVTKILFILEKSPMASIIITSQIISHVPASVLLSQFVHNSRDILLGANIGALGTLIASMASLITFKYYSKVKDSNILKYIKEFTIYNAMFMFILILLSMIFKGIEI